LRPVVWLTALGILGVALLISGLYGIVYPFTPLTALGPIIIVVVVALIGGIVLKSKGYRLAQHIFIFVVMVGLPSILLIVAAGKLGEEVSNGFGVDAEQTLAVPILDVDAPMALVTWTGPPAQKPSTVFTDTQNPFSRLGLFIGQSQTTVLVILVEPQVNFPTQYLRLVRLPIASVSVEVPLLVKGNPPVQPPTQH
jgi:hypothetical protein